MNVAVASSGHVPSRWAHSVAVAKNANGFAQLGHDVELLTVERLYERRFLDEVESVTEFYGIDPDIDVSHFVDRTPFYFQDVFPMNYLLDGLTYATLGAIRRPFDPEKRISKRCEDTAVDVCYCRCYRTAMYNVERGVPTIMESHTPVVRKPSLKRVVKLSSSPHFRSLVTIAESLKRNFVDAGVPAEKVVVLQDGVDLEQFRDTPSKPDARNQLGLPTEADIVTYVGSLHPDKGIEHILRVAVKLPDRRFQLVGGSEDEVRRWRSKANRLGADNVHFSGYVTNADVPEYLAAADVLLMPYDTERDVSLMDIESTSPLKLFEYLAAGRPIVSSDIPAISRTVSDGEDCLLAPPNDIDELAVHIRRALDDDELANRLSENARRTAERYTWKKRCRRILKHAGVSD